MNASPNKNLKPRLGLDFAIFAIVVVLCAFIARDFFNEPKAIPVSPVRAALKRTLATTSTLHTAVAERSTKIIDLGCLTQKSGKLVFETEAGLLRLKAQACGPVLSMRAENQTTKENLLLIQQGEKFSTPYFPLKEGDNQIRFEWKGKKGEAFSDTIAVRRQIPPG